MKTTLKTKCGCYVTDTKDSSTSTHIHRCSLHNAAQELLNACKLAVKGQQCFSQLEKAIAKAEGKGGTK